MFETRSEWLPCNDRIALSHGDHQRGGRSRPELRRSDGPANAYMRASVPYHDAVLPESIEHELVFAFVVLTAEVAGGQQRVEDNALARS